MILNLFLFLDSFLRDILFYFNINTLDSHYATRMFWLLGSWIVTFSVGIILIKKIKNRSFNTVFGLILGIWLHWFFGSVILTMRIASIFHIQDDLWINDTPIFTLVAIGIMIAAYFHMKLLVSNKIKYFGFLWLFFILSVYIYGISVVNI